MKVLWLIPAALAADQLSKAVVVHCMVRGQSVPVLGDYFRLTYIHNAGAAFGMNLGSPLLHTLLSVAAIAALVWVYRSTPPHQRLVRLALSLVLGGALGNIVDRVRLHEVIDFLDFGIGRHRWPVFNVADSLVTIGVLLLAFASTCPRPRAGQAVSSPDPAAASD